MGYLCREDASVIMNKKTEETKKPAKTPSRKKSAEPAPKKTARKAKNIQSEKAEQNSAGKVPDPFLADLARLSTILDGNPGILEPICNVFEYHLVDPIDRKTFSRLVNAMSVLLGPPAAMVILTACHVNTVSFFEDLFSTVRDDPKYRSAIWCLQQLTSTYGTRVHEAYSLSTGTMDEDWHTIDINTYKRESDLPSWVIDMRVSQYSGESTTIKMTPDSAFQLVDIIMMELMKYVPSEQVDPDLVARTRKHYREYYEKFYGKLKTKPGDDDHPAGYA